MSAIYQSEPPTNGKVVLNTTLGPIDIELWPKEAPKATRNFVQLCLDGHFDKCTFFRVIPSFIAQTGDPTNTGNGPNRTYLPNDETFPNELHSRLHFTHRGIVACAGTQDDASRNANQFFITLDQTPELEKKHTIFGKVVGDSIFNLMNINEMDMEAGFQDRLADPPSIISTNVVWNPFDDLFPRFFNIPGTNDQPTSIDKKPKSTTRAIKDFGLLSFGDEAEQDEQVFVSLGPKVTVAPTRTKKKTKITTKFDDDGEIEEEGKQERQATSTVSVPANEDEEWERQMKEKAKEWSKAERKADRRDERREERMLERRRAMAGKAGSDSDEASIDEDGNPTYRRRKAGQVEEIDAPKFKKQKIGETGDDDHRYETPLPSRATSNSKAIESAPKTKKPSRTISEAKEDSILAKLAAFKSKITKDSSKSSSKGSSSDWKTEALVFDKPENLEDHGARDMQRDDYEVYDPRGVFGSSVDPQAPRSSGRTRDSSSNRDYEAKDRDNSPPRRGDSPTSRRRASPDRARSYGSSPPRRPYESTASYRRGDRYDDSRESYRRDDYERRERSDNVQRERRESYSSSPRHRRYSPNHRRG
jgi:peptidyl-prolyl cis-trans isomerase SDCCAG10